MVKIENITINFRGGMTFFLATSGGGKQLFYLFIGGGKENFCNINNLGAGGLTNCHCKLPKDIFHIANKHVLFTKGFTHPPYTAEAFLE